MKSYEGLFVFPPESTPEVRKNQLKNLEDLILKFQGHIQQKTELGRKPLGYAIQKFREGYWLVCDFQMEAAQTAEFRRSLQLQEDLLKFMIMVKEPKAEKKSSLKPAPVVSQKPSRTSSAPTAHH